MFSNHHIMHPVGAASAGAETWLCPICGRRVLVRWEPTFEQAILEPGDEEVFHLSSIDAQELTPVSPLDAELITGQITASGFTAAHGSAQFYGQTSPFDAFVDFSDPDSTDGLGPWIRFLEQLNRGDTA